MNIFEYFKNKKPKSAQIAKERLQIVIAHQRMDRGGPDYLPAMRRDIIAAIGQYVKIDEEQINIQLEKGDDCDVLELNIALPEESLKSHNRKDRHP